jgi:hypothetical protein
MVEGFDVAVIAGDLLCRRKAGELLRIPDEQSNLFAKPLKLPGNAGTVFPVAPVTRIKSCVDMDRHLANRLDISIDVLMTTSGTKNVTLRFKFEL